MSDSPEGIRLVKNVRDKRGSDSPPIVARPPEYSDMGNAVRFVRQHGRDVRYCAEFAKSPCGGWLVWEPNGTPVAAETVGGIPGTVTQTGGRWRPDNVGEVMRKGKRTVESIKTENEQYATVADVESQLKHYYNSQSSGQLTAMLKLAQSELPIPCMLKDFDVDPMVLNVRNGTINLATGEFSPARREEMLMKQAPVEFNGKAECPLWTVVLQRMFATPGQDWTKETDQALIDYVARAVGYMLTGLARERACFLFYGLPSTGKGTFVETILSLLGEDYAIVTATESLTETRGFGQHPADLKAMEGRRLVIGTETGSRLNINKIKQMTGGGDTMTGRGMREDWKQLKPTWKLVLQTNELPRTYDEGYFNRLNLVPFDNPIPTKEVDPSLKEQLRTPEELSGILNWALKGLLDYHKQGLNPPPRMTEAAAQARSEVDDMHRFIGECMRVGPTLQCTSKELKAKYDWWCDVVEMLPQNSKSRRSTIDIGRVLTQAGFTKTKVQGDRGWRGLDVLEDGQRNHPLDEKRLKEESDRTAENNPLFQ
jgi:putative DNA primase/helicase